MQNYFRVVSIIVVLFFTSFNSFSQVKKFTFVKRTPKPHSYILEDESTELEEGYSTERERWLVMSDRVNNTTYKDPGSKMQLKSLDFLDACYVIGKKRGYLELIKFSPKLFKKPKQRFIADRKSAEYLGWVPESKLLLWRTALKEMQTVDYIKAITCIKNEDAINQFQDYTAGNDSLHVFNAPSTKDTLPAKCALEDIFYIYKKSDDGKHYLIGTAPQTTPENIKDIIKGWISKDFVQCWGTRLGLYVRTNANTKQDSLSFYEDSIKAVQSFIPVKNSFHTYYTKTATKKKLENLFPVQDFELLDDSSAVIKTGILTYTLDHNDNEVINILGHSLKYNQYKQIVNGQQKTNIVFVVDGGKENGKYMPNVMTVIQNLEVFFDTLKISKDYKYGVVIYKDNLGGACNDKERLPLTNDYGSVIRFLQKSQQDVMQCNNDDITQSMFLGTIKACQLLQDHKDENNIVVLIGGPGNNNIGYGYTETISNLSYVNARMLIFQTHSLANPTYNDFVIQSKNLVLQSTVNLSELKKEKLVDFNDAVAEPSFSLVTGDSGIYYLDFPAKSMLPGYVLFPSRGNIMKPAFLERCLDSLMHKADKDNNMIVTSLDRFFNTVGIRNTRILTPYQFHYPTVENNYLPLSFLKKWKPKSRPFYVPAWLAYKDDYDTTKNPRFGLLLSNDEYEKLIETLLKIAGTEDYTKKYQAARRYTLFNRFFNAHLYNHLHGIVRNYLDEKNIGLMDDRLFSTQYLNLAEVLQLLIGHRTIKPLWRDIELHMIKEDNIINENEGTTINDAVLLFLKECKTKAQWLKENINNDEIKFYSNGQPYYFVPAEHLP
ncbi:MAG TPA: type VI secretion system protein TssR [Chitinophagaceae bacterium]|nr:type VI secretion system protein TssR [Chitinophagaceae bacterium]